MLLSRVAEQLYWAARHVERASDTSRVVAEHTHMLVDLPTRLDVTWEPLLAITGSRSSFDERYPSAEESHVIAFLLADRDNPTSVLSSIVAARENLRSAREALPREAWQALNDLYLYATSHHTEAVDRRSRARFLDKVVAESRRFDGILAGAMSRDEAYTMLCLGQHVERADMTSRVLDVRAVALLRDRSGEDDGRQHDAVQWAAVLRSLSALQAYHRRRRGPTTGHPTVSFLLRDPDFPGSIAHCLTQVEDLASSLPRSEAVEAAARSAMRTLVAVANAPLDPLHDGIDEVQQAIAAVHDEVEATYFPRLPDEVAVDARAGGFGQSAEARSE
jgi:uncharacterized alpha-E superfamily protein